MGVAVPGVPWYRAISYGVVHLVTTKYVQWQCCTATAAKSFSVCPRGLKIGFAGAEGLKGSRALKFKVPQKALSSKIIIKYKVMN
jgi:hypothetical protein